MKVILICALLFAMSMSSCDREDSMDDTGERGVVSLSLEEGIVADSTVIFVFRKRKTTDTLITRKVVHGVTETSQAFSIKLPAGYYDFRVVANAQANHITVKPPYSQADVFIDYSDGTEPPLLAIGRATVNVGVDKFAVSGMIVVTPLVQLTIKDVPAGVDQIDIDLLNTGAGIYLNSYPSDEMAQSSIISSLYDVKGDSTYTVKIYCFPTVTKYGDSSLNVRCYDTEGKLVYRGSSAPFKIISRMLITCSFEEKTVARSSAESSSIILKWDYDERYF